MECGKCLNDLHDCACADVDERLRSATDLDGFAARWCMECDKHYARCRCAEPIWGIRVGGKVNVVTDWEQFRRKE